MANIISFPSGEPLQNPSEEEEEILDPNILVDSNTRDAMLSIIDGLKKLIESGRCHNLIVLAEDPMSGYPITELCLDPKLDRSELFGIMGLLDMIKMEISDAASMSPVLMLDGEILDPYKEPEDDDDDYED